MSELPANETLSPRSLTLERVVDILRAAGLRVIVDSTEFVYIRRYGTAYLIDWHFCSVTLGLITTAAFASESTRGQQLEFVNRMNARGEPPQVYTPQPGVFRMSYCMPLFGATPNSLAAFAKWFTDATLVVAAEAKKDHLCE